MKKRKAITLVEILIGVAVLSMLMIGIMQLFTSGVKNSAKTLTHQDNMEAANLLMTQIEYDLSKATSIESPESNGQKSDVASWKNDMLNDQITFTYSQENGKIKREIDNKGSKSSGYLTKDQVVTLKFAHYAIPIQKNNQSQKTERHAMRVYLEVSSKNSEVSPFEMERIIVVRSPL